jgi:hypothetical protein
MKHQFLREAKGSAASCIQHAYRCRLARRLLRRRQKLLVHAKEQKAALVLQCWYRKIHAKNVVKSKRALITFRNTMNNIRPDISAMSEEKLLEYVVLKVTGLEHQVPILLIPAWACTFCFQHNPSPRTEPDGAAQRRSRAAGAGARRTTSGGAPSRRRASSG